MTPTPQLLTDDTAAHLIEQTAEDRRREATLGRTWQGQPLLWTIGRHTLYYWLRTASPPLSDEAYAAIDAAKAARGTPEEARLNQAADAAVAASRAQSGPDQTRYLNALILLYLASHQPADWQPVQHDKDRFLAAIVAWADETLPPSVETMMEVARVTDKLLEDAETTRAIPQPKRSDPDTEGNSPSLCPSTSS